MKVFKSDIILEKSKATSRTSVMVQTPKYFMTIDEGNVFMIFKFNTVSVGLNINKHIVTYYSAVKAFIEFEKLTKEE